ncbi:kynurenine formamidase isoform X1 [Paramuricea clavata]|uniref:Kynurenine formamidase isoform X1 n=1 Tax=Paramuricea clavata TaxID=317549 RepID=A0A6S7K3J2_PARCT|nr:kynurenine formamidase isoform X1 [Paramuricea clavata]
MALAAKDVKHLEYQYSPSKWVIRSFSDGQDPVAHFVKFGLEVTEKLVKQLPCELNVVYGNGKKTKMDIYYPQESNNQPKNVLIFFHGGYWQEGSKESCAFVGSHLNDLDCILVMVGYDLAPDESMDGMVEQVKSAVVFTGKKFPSSRLFLMGHSAGAHLSAMMLTVDWENAGFPLSRFAGVCLLSGIFDLEPLLPTYINDPIKMDKECAARNSPVKLIQSGGLTLECKVLVVIAERDSPAFHEQSKDFHNLLKEKLTHHSAEYLEIPGVDHFDLLEKCAEKDFILNKIMSNFMKR